MEDLINFAFTLFNSWGAIELFQAKPTDLAELVEQDELEVLRISNAKLNRFSDLSGSMPCGLRIAPQIQRGIDQFLLTNGNQVQRQS